MLPESTSRSETNVEFPTERVTISLALSQVGPHLFRIESIPLMVEIANFGDVIEAAPGTDGSLRFLRIAERGGWRTYAFILTPEVIESASITAIQNRIVSLGGYWERNFGGVLFLCVPPATDYDPSHDIQMGQTI